MLRSTNDYRKLSTTSKLARVTSTSSSNGIGAGHLARDGMRCYSQERLELLQSKPDLFDDGAQCPFATSA
jgi:hypothetical protein